MEGVHTSMILCKITEFIFRDMSIPTHLDYNNEHKTVPQALYFYCKNKKNFTAIMMSQKNLMYCTEIKSEPLDFMKSLLIINLNSQCLSIDRF